MLRALRTLVLGETWSGRSGVAIAVGLAVVAREAAGAGGWWRDGGGFGQLVPLVLAYVAAMHFRR